MAVYRYRRVVIPKCSGITINRGDSSNKESQNERNPDYQGKTDDRDFLFTQHILQCFRIKYFNGWRIVRYDSISL